MSTPRDPHDPSRADEQIEQLISHVLRQQPLRTAPRSLEARVLAAIERHSALPWWHKSFLHWPLGVRVAFLLASIGVVKAALAAVMWLVTDERATPVVSAISRPLSWAEAIADFCSAAVKVGAAVLHAVPSNWLYVGIAVAAALYLALFVLGATAYRTLYANK
jgi:hypothetical protein